MMLNVVTRDRRFIQLYHIRFRIIKKKNQRGPGAAAAQHEKCFDFQPRGVFVFFPISDIRHQ